MELNVPSAVLIHRSLLPALDKNALMAKPKPKVKYRIAIYDVAGDSTKVYTEADILNEYWEYWSSKMTEKFGPNDPQITKQNCIDDWTVVNWAEKIK